MAAGTVEYCCNINGCRYVGHAHCKQAALYKLMVAKKEPSESSPGCAPHVLWLLESWKVRPAALKLAEMKTPAMLL